MNADLSKIYEMAEAFSRGSFRPDLPDYRAIGRDLLRSYHRGECIPLASLRLTWAEGFRMTDYTGTTATLPVVVSDRFVDVLREVEATGWSTYPIELHDKDSDLIEGYCALAVKGRCGPLLDQRSRIEMRVGPTGKSKAFKVGLYFDSSTWDGNDVFLPEGTSFVFATEKVKSAVEEAGLTNVAFTPLDSVSQIVY